MNIHVMTMTFMTLLSPATNPIDVLKTLDLSDSMEGVSLEAGLCISRRGSEEADLAYKIDKKIQVSIPTKQLFPGTSYTPHTDTHTHRVLCGLNLCVCVCVFQTQGFRWTSQ